MNNFIHPPNTFFSKWLHNDINYNSQESLFTCHTVPHPFRMTILIFGQEEKKSNLLNIIMSDLSFFCQTCVF